MNTNAILDEHANAIGDRGADGGGPALRRARRWPASADAVRPRPERAHARQRTIGRVAGVLFSPRGAVFAGDHPDGDPCEPFLRLYRGGWRRARIGDHFRGAALGATAAGLAARDSSDRTVEVTLAVWAAGVHGGIYATY